MSYRDLEHRYSGDHSATSLCADPWRLESKARRAPEPFLLSGHQSESDRGVVSAF
jgi:hypothetical protein